MTRISFSSIAGRVLVLFILVTGLLSFTWHLEGEGIAFSPFLARAEDHFFIQVHLFRTAAPQNQTGALPTGVLTAAEHPELISIKEAAARSDKEFEAAVIKTLLDMYDLTEVEDLFVYEKPWDGRGTPSFKDKVLGSIISYNVSLRPHKYPSGQMGLGIAISTMNSSESAQGNSGEVVVSQELLVDMEDPVLIAVPYKGQTYFMTVRITAGSQIIPTGKEASSEKNKNNDVIAVPTAIVKVAPDYPEELRHRHIGGQIGLRLTVDGNGNVVWVEVLKPLHPYLNYTTVQAFRQWKYEPVVRDGKPIPVKFYVTVEFDSEISAAAKAGGEKSRLGTIPFSQENLPAVLAGVGNYCEKLDRSALDFICEETIKEIHYDLLDNIQFAQILTARPLRNTNNMSQADKDFSDAASSFHDSVDQNQIASQNYQLRPPKVITYMIMNPKKTIRNVFLCDYQIIRKGDALTERRFLMKANGQKITEQNKPLEEKRFSGLSSLLAPLRVIARDKQAKFEYAIAGEEKFHGEKTYVIRAVPKSGDEDGVWSARIWLDKKSFRILKCEIEGVPIDGYDEILNDCVKLNIKPEFLMSHGVLMISMTQEGWRTLDISPGGDTIIIANCKTGRWR